MTKCDNCHRMIGDLESPTCWSGHVVCLQCARVLLPDPAAVRTPAHSLVPDADTLLRNETPQGSVVARLLLWGIVGILVVVALVVLLAHVDSHPSDLRTDTKATPFSKSILDERLVEKVWKDSAENFAAAFPSTPKKIEASGTSGKAYAYQSAKHFSDRGALYAITVAPTLTDIPPLNVVEIIENASRVFLYSMNAERGSIESSWAPFGDKKRLNYSCRFQHGDNWLRGRGFWIADGNRIIRVSVAYLEGMSHSEVIEIERFLDTFVIVSAQ